MTERHVWRLERVEHPIVSVFVATDDQHAVTLVHFGNDYDAITRWAARFDTRLEQRAGSPSSVSRQLVEYLDGQRHHFDVALRMLGTEFQCRAWKALQAIPYGETRSYSDQARALGQPEAVRAVGRANGSNPLPIVVPCHRVIGKSGALTGFGGGIAVKQRLLALEAAQRDLFAPAARVQ